MLSIYCPYCRPDKWTKMQIGWLNKGVVAGPGKKQTRKDYYMARCWQCQFVELHEQKGAPDWLVALFGK